MREMGQNEIAPEHKGIGIEGRQFYTILPRTKCQPFVCVPFLAFSIAIDRPNVGDHHRYEWLRTRKLDACG